MNVSIYVTCYRWTENRKHYNIELLGSSFESYPSKVTKSFIINCRLMQMYATGVLRGRDQCGLMQSGGP